MANDNDEYHLTLEWRSEESSSEDEAPPSDDTSTPLGGSSKLGEETPPGNRIIFDPAVAESGSTLRSPASSQSSISRESSSPSHSFPEFPIPQSNISPRGYQLELYRRACKENVIAFLDTGAGKTLVAALLVRKTLEDFKVARQVEKSSSTCDSSQSPPPDSEASTDLEIASDASRDSTSLEETLPQERVRDDLHDKLMLLTPKPLPRRARKIAVFLVHRVPLVPQQANVVRSVLPAEDQVGAYYGEKGVDDWSSSKWAKSLRSKSALVMTAQIFLNLLRHGLIDIRDVALLIVDEVHHATKGHPYRRIFVEFYHTIKAGDARPRVFGMTATPVKRKSSYSDQGPYLTALAELEATLDATVVAVSSEGQSEIETLVPKPEELIVTFRSQEPDSGIDEYGEEDVERENDILSRLADLPEKTCEKEQVGSESISMKDGPPCPQTEHERASDEQQEYSDIDMTVNDRLSADYMELVKRICRKLGYKAAVDFATQLCRISDISPDITLQALLEESNDEEIHDSSIPERVSKLLDVLCSEYMRARSGHEEPDDLEQEADRFQCIVFVEERSTALSLTWLINSVFAPLKCSELVARSVVGAQNSDSVVRMSRGNLNRTIDDFRQGKYGILVSTSVVEEGLDIPACSLVVAFDLVLSPTSYIQARGRARKKGARYVAFVQEGSVAAYERLFLARRGARIMTEVAKHGLRAEISRQSEEAENLKCAMAKEKTLYSRTTGARVSATEALNLLHRYCYMKGGNTDWPTYKPTYNVSECDGKYIATVTLHSSIQVDCGLCEEPLETALLAKRHAALDAYGKLYQIGEVDEYLLPRRTARSQRVLRMTKKCHDLSMRAFTRRSKQRPRREIASKASKKNKRVRVCRVAHPPIVQISEVQEANVEEVDGKEADGKKASDEEATGEEADDEKADDAKADDAKADDEKADDENAEVQELETDEPEGEERGSDVNMRGGKSENEVLHLYKVSLDCDMHDHKWYPSRKHEVFGILARAQIPSDDQKVIRCPQGDSLFTLSFLREVSLCSYLSRIVCKYVRFLQLCLRGRTPGSEAALDIEENQYKKAGKIGFFLVPLVESSPLHLDIDWANMQRLLTFGWRFGPPEEHESYGNRVLEHSLVCSYHENLDRVYLSGSLRTDLTADVHPGGFLNSSYNSFAHYYRKKHGVVLSDPEQVLLEGFSVRETICNLSVSTFMLPQETCRIIPVSPLACFITSILPVWQTFLALRTCWRRNSISENPVDFLMFARALQPNINNVAKKEADLSYERLEFLGDAVLKVIYSMVTFVKNPDDSEGLLSDERDLEVSNQRLADLAMEMQLQNCVAFSGVSQKVRSWPWYWGTHQNEPIRISEKVLADCVEALIGAQYLHGGVHLATEFMDRHNLLPGASQILQITPDNLTGAVTSSGASVKVPPMGPGDKRHEFPEIREVEKIIGYEFQDKRHLVVALTHGSFENGLISSYQRYEYLGDAIVGFLLLSHYFKQYPNLGPGELTAIRGPALSNDLFARVIVSAGLHRTIWHNCPPLQREINKFAELYANEENDDEDVSKIITVPKVLADLLESIIGAIVVDKGMRLDGVKDIVLRVMHEELSRFANPDKFKHNPISELVRLVQQSGSARPNYEYLEDSSDLKKTCVVSMDDKELGRGTGPTRRVAKRQASIAALNFLRREGVDIGGGCTSKLLCAEAGTKIGLTNKA